MTLLKTDATGAIAQYPYQAGDLLADHPHTSFPLPLDPADLADFGVHLVAETAPPAVTLAQNVVELPPAQVEGVWTQQWGVVDAPAPEVAARRQALVDGIDAACAAIYTRVGRFAEEYKEREAQALAYQAAGYTGTVPRQVAAFATPAGVTPTYATDLILSQAAQLRGALSALGELRMRKYEVMGAASQAAAVAAHAQIMAAIAAVGAAI